jgi:hypothetical protein
VALFVLIIVALIVAQTWLDWRDTSKGWRVPDWAKGAALAGVLAVSLTAVTSFASAWILDPANQWAIEFGSRLFWPELVFLFCMMGIIGFAVRKKRLRLMLLLAAIVLSVFSIGLALS